MPQPCMTSQHTHPSGVGVAVGVMVGVGVAVLVGVDVPVAVDVGSGVGVAVGSGGRMIMTVHQPYENASRKTYRVPCQA